MFTQIISTSSNIQRTNHVLISLLDSVIVFKISVLFFNRRQILLLSFKNYFSAHKTQTLWTVDSGRILVLSDTHAIRRKIKYLQMELWCNKQSSEQLTEIYSANFWKVLKFELWRGKDNGQLVYACKLKENFNYNLTMPSVLTY